MGKLEIGNLDILVLALARWDSDYASTAYSFALEFSKKNRVFYIDNPFTVTDFLRNPRAQYFKRRTGSLVYGKTSVREVKKNLFVITPRLMLPINWLPPGLFYDYLSEINNYSISSTVNSVLLDYSISNYIYINSFNPFYKINFLLNRKPKLSIYQSVDNIEKSRYIDRHGPYLESAYVRDSDFSFVTSSYLQKKLSKVGENIYCIPNAAQTDHFRKVVEKKFVKPDELKNVNNDIIGYVGNHDQRVDIDILINIAESLPDKILLLIGPVDSSIMRELSKLKKFKNVIFTGIKKYQELPQYISYMDCCIIPFKENELTKCIYPLKINEYLAAGKPVVATNFSEDLHEFSNDIDICSDQNDFVNRIQKCILEDTNTKKMERVKVSIGNNWESRVNQFWSIVKVELNKKTNL